MTNEPLTITFLCKLLFWRIRTTHKTGFKYYASTIEVFLKTFLHLVVVIALFLWILLKIIRSRGAKDSIFELSIEFNKGCVVEWGFIEEMSHMFTPKLRVTIFAVENIVEILIVVAGTVVTKVYMWQRMQSIGAEHICRGFSLFAHQVLDIINIKTLAKFKSYN